MSASILVVDDEPDAADLFRQCFRRETRQGTYVMHFAVSDEKALDWLAEQIQPALMAVLSDINCRHGRLAVAQRNQATLPQSARADGDRLW
jgi:CheY-like chemotaxis protein